jgi:hypothetical protein
LCIDVLALTLILQSVVVFFKFTSTIKDKSLKIYINASFVSHMAIHKSQHESLKNQFHRIEKPKNIFVKAKKPKEKLKFRKILVVILKRDKKREKVL